MKRKCQKCRGKGGWHVMKPGRFHVEIWRACVDCLGQGVSYDKKGPSAKVKAARKLSRE